MIDQAAADETLYPCDDCGKLRTKAEGGTVFTVCDGCWDKRHPPRDPAEVLHAMSHEQLVAEILRLRRELAAKGDHG